MPITDRRRIRAKAFAIPPLFKCVLRFLVFLVLSSPSTLLYAQTVDIKLVDGRNGRPMTASCVNVGVGAGNEGKRTIAIPTDKDGIARLRLTDNDGEMDIHNRSKDCGLFGVINPVVKYDDFLAINVGYVLCQPRAPDYSWLAIREVSTKQLMHQGIVMPNTCGKATASPKPGEVIIFVRPLNWREKLKQ
jgi:hypothetical protein